MPIYKSPLKDFDFIINHFLPLSKYKEIAGFSDAIDMHKPVLEAAADMCESSLFPLNQVGDKEGLKYDDGFVTMPTGFKQAYKDYISGGWTGFTCKQEYGGQDLPEFLNLPIMEMVCSANLSFGLTPGLSHGAYNALLMHASDEIKNLYMPKLVAGVWSGVMCLTEPQAGTDLGLISTKAEIFNDNSWSEATSDQAGAKTQASLERKLNNKYSITGNKIFISSGEHDLTENILHLVLARLPDAPKGIKGISLFLVPKFLVNQDGSLGERNTLKCTAIEHKMGLTASPTCAISYDGATGYLIGEPHKGMRAMFTMMNAARIYVGIQGLGLAEVAYQNALGYASERLQSRSISGVKLPNKPADTIISHPDVKLMILTMRAFTQSARALAMLTALNLDLSHRHTDAKTRQDADDFVQLMTPIIKSYFTDMGSEISNLAVQVYGGYGYIKEYGVEQFVRDARITQIYEGTNGIQALDLVFRKLTTYNGRYLRQFFHKVDEFINQHKDNDIMAEFIKPLAKHIGYLQQATIYMLNSAAKNPEDAAAGATQYQKMFSLVVLAWIWALQAEIAVKDKDNYQEKIDTARFYFAKILPNTVSLLQTITSGAKTLAF